MPATVKFILIAFVALHASGADGDHQVSNPSNVPMVSLTTTQSAASIIKDFAENGRYLNCAPATGKTESPYLQRYGRNDFGRERIQSHLQLLSESDLKKLVQIKNTFGYYDDFGFENFLNMQLPDPKETDAAKKASAMVDRLYRLWVKFDLYAVPENATPAQKAELRRKNQELTHESLLLLKKHFYMTYGDIASIYDDFYLKATGKKLSDEFNDKKIPERRKELEKQTTVSSRIPDGIESWVEHGLQGKGSLGSGTSGNKGCFLHYSPQWLAAHEKANLLYQLAKKGYGITDPVENPGAVAGGAGCSPLLSGKPGEACTGPQCQAITVGGIPMPGSCGPGKGAKKPFEGVAEPYVREFLELAMGRQDADRWHTKKKRAYPYGAGNAITPQDIAVERKAEQKLAAYQSLMEPILKQAVNEGLAAKKAVTERDTKMKADGLEHGNGHTARLLSSVELGKAILPLPPTDHDAFFGKEYTVAGISPDEFREQIKDRAAFNSGKLKGYIDHLQDRIKQSDVTNEIAAKKDRDPHAINDTLKRMQATPSLNCNRDTELLGELEKDADPSLRLQRMSDQKLIDLSYVLRNETGAKWAKARSLVAQRMHAKLQDEKNLLFKPLRESMKDPQAVPLVRVIAQNGVKEAYIDWPKVLHSTDQGSPYEHFLLMMLPEAHIPTASFLEEPTEWWAWAENLDQNFFNRIGELDCLTHAFITKHLTQMKARLDDPKDENREDLDNFMKERIAAFNKAKEKATEDRGKDKKLYQDLLKIAQAEFESRKGPFAVSSEALVNLDPTTLMDMLNRPGLGSDANGAAHALLLPPHLYAAYMHSKNVLAVEKKRLEPDTIKLENSKIQEIESLTPEEITREWNWFYQNKPSVSQTQIYLPAVRRDDGAGRITRMYRYFAGDPLINHVDLNIRGPLEILGGNRMEDIKRTRQASQGKSEEKPHEAPGVLDKVVDHFTDAMWASQGIDTRQARKEAEEYQKRGPVEKLESHYIQFISQAGNSTAKEFEELMLRGANIDPKLLHPEDPVPAAQEKRRKEIESIERELALPPNPYADDSVYRMMRESRKNTLKAEIEKNKDYKPTRYNRAEEIAKVRERILNRLQKILVGPEGWKADVSGENSVLKRLENMLKSEDPAKGGDPRLKQELIAIGHVLKMLDTNLGQEAPSFEKNPFKPEELAMMLPQTHGGNPQESPADSAGRYLAIATAELQNNLMHRRDVSVAGRNGTTVTWGSRTYAQRQLDTIGNPNRDKALKDPTFKQNSEDGLKQIEKKTGPIPTESKLKLYQTSPYTKMMLSHWFRPDVAPQFQCEKEPAVSIDQKITGFDGKTIDSRDGKKAFLYRLLVEASPTTISEATLLNRAPLQGFLASINGLPEMEALNNAGVTKTTLLGLLCQGGKPNFKTVKEMKAALHKALKDMLAKCPPDWEKNGFSHMEDSYDDKGKTQNKPLTVEMKAALLASHLLGMLDSYGNYDLDVPVKTGLGGDGRFTPAIAKVIDMENQAIETAKKDPNLAPRLATVETLENFLHAQNTGLSPVSRMALLSEAKPGALGVTKGNLESLTSIINQMKHEDGSFGDGLRRDIRRLIMGPDAMQIARATAGLNPGLARHTSKMDQRQMITEPLIASIQRGDAIEKVERTEKNWVDCVGMSESEEELKLHQPATVLEHLACQRYKENYADAIAVNLGRSGSKAAMKEHLMKNFPDLMRVTEMDLRREAATRTFEAAAEKRAKEMGIEYPPKNYAEMDKILTQDHAGQGALLVNLSKDKGFLKNMQEIYDLYHPEGKGEKPNRKYYDSLTRLATSHLITKTVQRDLADMTTGKPMPACMAKAFKETAFGSLSDGVMTALKDIGEGKFRPINTDVLTTMNWSNSDLARADRGVSGNTDYGASFSESRRNREIDIQLKVAFLVLPAQQELEQARTKLRNTEREIAFLTTHELDDSKRGEEIKKLREAERKQKEDVSHWEATLQERLQEAQQAKANLIQRENGIRNYEGNDVDVVNNRKAVEWRRVFGDKDVDAGTWAALYQKYCLKDILPDNLQGQNMNFNQGFGLNIIGRGEEGNRGIRLTVLDELAKRQDLLANGRDLALRLTNAGKGFPKKDDKATTLDAYEKQSPNRALLSTWLNQARESGVPEAKAREMMNGWLQTGEKVGEANDVVRKRIISEVAGIKVKNPDTGKIENLGLHWNGVSWDMPDLSKVANLSETERNNLSAKLDTFAHAQPGAENIIKDLDRRIRATHAQTNLSTHFALDDKTAVIATRSEQAKREGRGDYDYKLVPHDKVADTIGDILKEINDLMNESFYLGEKMHRLQGGLDGMVNLATAGNGSLEPAFWRGYWATKNRREQILYKLLPEAIKRLEAFGNMKITKDPTRKFLQQETTAMVAAADLTLQNMEMGYDHLLDMQKVRSEFWWNAGENALWAIAEVATAGTASLAMAGSKALRVVAAVAHGASAAARIHKWGQVFNWATQNGLALGWETYYKNFYDWDEAMKNGGGDFKLVYNNLIDKNQNNIPDSVETGYHAWAMEDPKSSFWSLVKSMGVFAGQGVLNVSQITGTLETPFGLTRVTPWQHALNFGISGAINEVAWGAFDPEKTWGHIAEESALHFVRGTLYGLPIWRGVEATPLGKLMEKYPTWGPRLAQFGGLQGIDFGLYSFDYVRHWNQSQENNPGWGGFFTGAIDAQLQAAAMNGMFAWKVPHERNAHLAQQKITAWTREIMSGKRQSLRSVVKEKEATAETMAEAANAEIEVKDAIMTMSVHDLNELAKIVPQTRKGSDEISSDLKFLAETLQVPPSRLRGALEHLANVWQPFGDKAKVRRNNNPMKEPGPTGSREQWWKLQEHVANEIAKDYNSELEAAEKIDASTEKGKRKKLAKVLSAKRKLMEDLKAMGPNGLQKFDLDKLVNTLDLENEGKTGSGRTYDRFIADVIGRKVGGMWWYSADQKGLDFDDFSTFIRRFKDPYGNLKTKRLAFQRAFSTDEKESAEAILDMLVRKKLDVETVDNIFGQNRLRKALDLGKEKVAKQQMPKNLIEDYVPYFDGMVDAEKFVLSAQELRHTTEAEKLESARIAHNKLVDEIVTQRPSSIAYLSIPFVNLNSTFDLRLVSKMAETAKINEEELKNELRHHQASEDNRVDGVNNLGELIKYAQSQGRLKPRS